MTRKHSSTRRGEEEIEAVVNELGLSDSVKAIATAIINRARSEEVLSGRAIETSADAAVVLACKQEGIPYSISDVVDASPVTTDNTKVNRTQRKLQRELGIEATPPSPEDYVPRFIQELGLSEEIEESVKEILDKVLKADSSITSGKSPTNVAGTVIYLATRLNGGGCTQNQIKTLADVSGVTIRSIYKEFILTIDEHNLSFDSIDDDVLQKEINKVKNRDTSKYVGSKDNEEAEAEA